MLTKQEQVVDVQESFTTQARKSLLKSVRVKARVDEIEIREIVEAGIILATQRTGKEIKAILASYRSK